MRMRHALIVVFCLPLMAQLPIELMRKPSLTRSGMTAGVNLTGGVDTQSIASLPPGTATLVRGANTGASTDDPAVSLAGWTFDSGDRVSGLPAKGAAWSTTNCSGVECYTITSAGTEYVNGVARRNWARWSENFSKWTAIGLTGSEGGIKETATGATHRLLFSFASGSAQNYITQVEVKADGRDYLFIANPARGQGRVYNLATGELGGTVGYAAPTASSITPLGDGWYLCSATTLAVGTSDSINISLSSDGTALSYDGDITKGVLLRKARHNLGASVLEYQKTTDSREWALETVGNYTGLLTWWGRKDRVIGPGEALNDYRGYIRPTVNARGNTLP